MTERLHFHMEGQGDPVVLLHSGGMSGRQWKRLSQTLSGAYQVIMPDFLGSGANPPWDEPTFDFQQDVDLVADLLAPFPRFHLVGHSYGGLVALTLARQNPERVLSLAVYDPVAWGVLTSAGDPEGVAEIQAIANNPLFFDDTRGGGPEWWELFIDYWNGPGGWKGLGEATQAGFLKVGKKVYAEVRSLGKYDLPGSAYACIEAPTLLMTGERTPIAARRVVALLADILPRTQLLEIAGAGHMGPITHADYVNERIEDNIRRAAVTTA